MRRSALIFLLFPWAVSAQEDCELFNLQDLAEAYLTTQVDSIVLHLSNGNTQTLDFSNGLNIKFGCTDPAFDEYDPAAIVDDGSCTSLACSEVEMDGYTYAVVEIEDQCWFAENLRTTVYSNGSSIPEVTDNTAWTGLSAGARCDYDNDADNVATFGRLYNWYATTDASGLCPAGWHVPTDGEWTELKDYITAQGFSGTEGTALKSTTGWSSAFSATDDFGFSALPGGIRFDYDGNFNAVGNLTGWWSSSSSGENAFFRQLINLPAMFRYANSPRLGFSVRCLRDSN